MTLKTLVTGVAAAALVGGAAAGVTSIASGPISAAPAVQPVVLDIPLPQAPAPDLQGALLTTLATLAGPGSFGPNGNKAAFIQGGTGRIEGIAADRAYNNAAAEGKFPLSFRVANIDQIGSTATANVTATAATGAQRDRECPVRPGPGPGWQISKGSALSLLSSVG